MRNRGELKGRQMILKRRGLGKVTKRGEWEERPATNQVCSGRQRPQSKLQSRKIYFSAAGAVKKACIPCSWRLVFGSKTYTTIM